jgi:hypothetical protein
MSPRIVTSAITVLVLVTLLNIWFYPDRSASQQVRTSLGHGPLGSAAAYDLLSELGFSVERSYVHPGKLDDDAVVWFIEPYQQTRFMDLPVSVLEDLRPWVERGGTAIVFGYANFGWSMLNLEVEYRESTPLVVPSLLSEQEWNVDPGPEPIAFIPQGNEAESNGDFNTPGETKEPASDASTASEEPQPRFQFVVEVAVGEGRVVAISDSRFLLNPNLDQADHAALVAELAHAYGTPFIDERFHGLRETQTLIALIGPGQLALLALTMTLLGSVSLLSQNRWLAKTDKEPAAIEATLGAFVEALQHHYARTKDYAQIFLAYREGFLHRLRRQQHHGDSERNFEIQLSRDRNLNSEMRRWLIQGELPTGETEMTEAVRALERFAQRRG